MFIKAVAKDILIGQVTYSVWLKSNTANVNSSNVEALLLESVSKTGAAEVVVKH